MEDLFPILDFLEQHGKKVLATIIHVEGSAYKKEGSMMLFLEDGTQIGMLSAGCLEIDLAFRAEEVFEKAVPLTIQYDMSEQTDLAWGQGAGCNGKIDILLEPLSDELSRNLLKIKDLLNQQIPVLVFKHLETHEDLYIPSKGMPFGTWKGAIPSEFREVKSQLIGSIFQQQYLPKPRLIIFGAGPDARPLVSLASQTGFSTIVCDWREGFCQREYFQTADTLIVAYPKDIIKRISLTSDDVVVIMSHHFEKDQEFLLMLLREKLKYIGVLGPKERTKRLLKGEEVPNWIDSPLGLAIGAKGPEEIAVSVMAKIIQVIRTQKVSHLWTVPE